MPREAQAIVVVGRERQKKGCPNARDEAGNVGLPASGCLSAKCI